MCNCKSYNWEVGDQPEVVLDIAAYFPESAKENGVCIDACIAESVKALWKEGIFTRGSCCGHNKTPSSVIIENASDLKKAQTVLAGTNIESIMVWELATYPVMPEPPKGKQNE